MQPKLSLRQFAYVIKSITVYVISQNYQFFYNKTRDSEQYRHKKLSHKLIGFYNTTIWAAPNIPENWNVLILYVDNKLISSDKAESTFSKLFNENRIQNIYIARLHFREMPTNIKGYIRVTTVK